MVANSKSDFLFQLHNELHKIGIDDCEEIFADFEEHFKASQNEGLTEEETCRRLGDVKEIARNYVDIEDSRLNSFVAMAIENDRPHVSLTKPGRDVPADLTLVKEEQPVVREYTPEHISEEIYPESSPVTEPAPNAEPMREYTPEHIAEEVIPQSQPANDQPESSSDKGKAEERKSVNEAFAAAGKAIAEAFNSDAMKNAGKSAADAVKTAGQAVAEAIQEAKDKMHEEHNNNNNSSDRFDYTPVENDNPAPENDSKPKHDPFAGSKAEESGGKKNMHFDKSKPRFSLLKFIIAILLDFFVWSWVLPALLGIDFGILFGAFPSVLSAGFGAFFGSSFIFISRLFLSIGLISLALIILGLGILAVKGTIKLIKFIIRMHIEAFYEL